MTPIRFVLYAVLVAGLTSAVWYRILVAKTTEAPATAAAATAEEEAGPQTPGFWRPARDVGADGGGDEASGDHAEAMRELETIGYLGGSRPATQTSGVTRHDRERAYPGINLYVSGHGPEALLMDMDGRVLHTWRKPFEELWPDYELTGRDPILTREFFSRFHLFPNGDLLAIFEGYGIFKLDKDSGVIWENANRAHHDLFVMPDGRIYTLTREGKLERRFSKKPILEDYVTVLEADGTPVKSVSVLEAYEKSPFAPALNPMKTRGDLLHTNAIQVLDGRFAERIPAFREGNVLVSCRDISTLAVIDMESEVVVWSLGGLFHRQHMPDFVGNGNMLLFDNLGSLLPHLHPHGRSSIVEFDPVTLEVAWKYEGTEESPFDSDIAGTVHRLPNGNTLIAESVGGRAFEVAPDKTIVWEYRNPERAGENGEYVAALFDMHRFGPEFPMDWVESGE